MKPFLKIISLWSLLLCVNALWLTGQSQAQEETPVIRTTPNHIFDLEEAKAQMVSAVQLYLLEAQNHGFSEKSLAHRHHLFEYWKNRGICEEILSATWNSYIILGAQLIAKRYAVALWQSPESDQSEITQTYLTLLSRIIGNEAAKTLLEHYGRETEPFIQIAQEVSNLQIAEMILTKGFDPTGIKFFELPEETLSEWDTVLKRIQRNNGEEISRTYYRHILVEALRKHDFYLKRFIRLTEDRGLWENLEGTFWEAWTDSVPNSDENNEERENAFREIRRWSRTTKEIGASETITQSLLLLEQKAVEHADELLERDRTEWWFALFAPAMVIATALCWKIAIIAGVASKIATLLVSIPLAVGAVKGAGHFIISGVDDPERFRGQNFYNEVMGQLFKSLPYSAAAPLLGGGISATAARLSAPAGSTLIQVAFYTPVGLATTSGTIQIAKGIEEIQSENHSRGAILIFDGTIDLAMALGLVSYARPSSPPRSIENRGFPQGFSLSGREGSPNPFSTPPQSAPSLRLSRPLRISTSHEQTSSVQHAPRETAVLEIPQATQDPTLSVTELEMLYNLPAYGAPASQPLTVLLGGFPELSPRPDQRRLHIVKIYEDCDKQIVFIFTYDQEGRQVPIRILSLPKDIPLAWALSLYETPSTVNPPTDREFSPMIDVFSSSDFTGGSQNDHQDLNLGNTPPGRGKRRTVKFMLSRDLHREYQSLEAWRLALLEALKQLPHTQTHVFNDNQLLRLQQAWAYGNNPQDRAKILMGLLRHLHTNVYEIQDNADGVFNVREIHFLSNHDLLGKQEETPNAPPSPPIFPSAPPTQDSAEAAAIEHLRQEAAHLAEPQTMIVSRKPPGRPSVSFIPTQEAQRDLVENLMAIRQLFALASQPLYIGGIEISSDKSSLEEIVAAIPIEELETLYARLYQLDTDVQNHERQIVRDIFIWIGTILAEGEQASATEEKRREASHKLHAAEQKYKALVEAILQSVETDGFEMAHAFRREHDFEGLFVMGSEISLRDLEYLRNTFYQYLSSPLSIRLDPGLIRIHLKELLKWFKMASHPHKPLLIHGVELNDDTSLEQVISNLGLESLHKIFHDLRGLERAIYVHEKNIIVRIFRALERGLSVRSFSQNLVDTIKDSIQAVGFQESFEQKDSFFDWRHPSDQNFVTEEFNRRLSAR